MPAAIATIVVTRTIIGIITGTIVMPYRRPVVITISRVNDYYSTRWCIVTITIVAVMRPAVPSLSGCAASNCHSEHNRNQCHK